MSADTLREAARLMRERAEKATPGRWRFTDSEVVNDVWEGGMVVVNADQDPIANIQDDWYESDPGEPAPIDDAQHIASWHPGVALAVADWLESVAGRARSGTFHAVKEVDTIRALAVARAYLGETS